jgi:hypothetical protein
MQGTAGVTGTCALVYHSLMKLRTKYFIANGIKKMNKERTLNADGKSTFIRREMGWDLIDFGIYGRAVLKLMSDKQVAKIDSRGSDALHIL